jgi:hypothetical protein
MIHYFIKWFEYNDHHEKYMRHVLSGMDETQISKRKSCSENLGSLVVGCHPRYRQVQAPAAAGAGESEPRSYQSHCLGLRAQFHAPATPPHTLVVPPADA